MKLEYALANLIAGCERICESECCGIGAYDFSPVHIASYLITHNGTPDVELLTQLRAQLDVIRQRYGTQNPRQPGVTIEDMNQTFAAHEVDLLVEEIHHNLGIALFLIEEAEARRFKIVKDYPN